MTGFYGALDKDDFIGRRSCNPTLTNQGLDCGSPYCDDSSIRIGKCDTGICDYIKLPCKNIPCMNVDCETYGWEFDNIDFTAPRCVYQLKNSPEGKYCSLDTGHFRDFITYCKAILDCTEIKCFDASCIGNKCKYTPKQAPCDGDDYCHIENGSCYPRVKQGASTLKICRIESEDDYTVYKDYIYFELPPHHVYLDLDYFEIQAGKSTHDYGDWADVGTLKCETKNEYFLWFDPVNALNFRPNAYRVRFNDTNGDYSLWETEIVRKRDACEPLDQDEL